MKGDLSSRCVTRAGEETSYLCYLTAFEFMWIATKHISDYDDYIFLDKTDQ